MSLANFSATTLRLTFRVGVSSPVSSVKSTGRMRNLRMASALDTAWLASLIASWTSAIRSGSVARSPTVALLPTGEGLRVDGDQRGDERLRVADGHRLADQRVRPQPVFQDRRCDVLATRGDDYLLLAADDRQEAVIVDGAEIAGVEPTVGEDGLGLLFVVPVTVEHHTALDEQFAIVGKAHAVAGQELSDRADLHVVDPVHGDRRTGLGESVALIDGQADAAIEMAEPGTQRRAARDRAAAVTAQRGAQLAVHQPIEQGVLGPQQQPRPALVLRLAVFDRGVDRRFEDPALAIVSGVLFCGRS